MAKAFGTPRRTVLLESDGMAGKDAITAVPLEVEDGPCWVMLSATGLVARTSEAAPPSREGGRVVRRATQAENDSQTVCTNPGASCGIMAEDAMTPGEAGRRAGAEEP